VASGPIRIVSNSSVIPPAPVPPVLASEPLVWKGLRLEVHDVPKGELPERVSFDRHLPILSYGSDPFRKYRRECGRERSVLVRPGDTALVSHQEIAGHRWDRPCRLIAAGIDDNSLNEILAEELADRATGAPVTQVREDIRTVEVVARSAGGDRLDPRKLNDMTLTNRLGKAIPLSQVGHIEIRPEEPILKRRDRLPTITVESDIDESLQPPQVSVG